MPDFSHESSHSGIIAGVDEAGCGPLAGPVVAAAAILNIKSIPEGINDCKKLQRGERERLFGEIMVHAHIGVGIASVGEIDTLNIWGATKLAMLRAVQALTIQPDMALVDGKRKPELPCSITTIIGGDGKSLSIAAASIIAKVTRDRIMRALAEECPHYGWERNAGYGTAQHYEALAAHGVTHHHRKSYAPIRGMLEATQLHALSS